MPTPNYQPPSHQYNPTAPLNERFRFWVEYWDKFFIYTRNFLNRVDPTPVEAIAAATTITPLRTVQPVTGSATIDTIDVPTIFGSVVTLLAEAGFNLATGGNIAAAKAVGVGEAVTLYFNVRDNLWYPES